MTGKNAHEFRDLIKEHSGEDIGNCIQCGKCTSGCPVAAEMDYVPNQVMQLIRMNDQDTLLRANTFWFCVACQTCSARCPEDIDIAKVMNTLRRRALAKDIAPGMKEVPKLNQVFLDSIKSYGRVYELGMVMKYNMITAQPFKDATFGPAMFFKGKIALLPHKVKKLEQVKNIIRKAKKYP